MSCLPEMASGQVGRRAGRFALLIHGREGMAVELRLQLQLEPGCGKELCLLRDLSFKQSMGKF
jgi:hypothetical protein